MKRTPPLSSRGVVAAVLVALVLVGAVATFVVTRPSRPDSPDTPAAGPGTESIDPRDPALSLRLDAERKTRAAQITSSFENATLDLQYDYVENIGDRRGITAGRAGFTSATGDLLLLVRRYAEVRPDNGLVRYIPALEAVNGTDSEAGLDGFAEAWAEAAQDPELRRLQDAVVDELYFSPAMDMADQAGITTPLGQTIFWDTMIQHGKGGENGTLVIIEETRQAVGDVGTDETAWLNAFLDARLHHLFHAYEDTTATADAASRSRIAALRSLLDQGQLALEPPLTWEVYGSTYELAAT